MISIRIDYEQLGLTPCPECVQGLVWVSGEPFFCLPCDGSAFLMMDRRVIEPKRPCAWCMTDAERAAQPADTSHSICKPCMTKVLAQHTATRGEA